MRCEGRNPNPNPVPVPVPDLTATCHLFQPWSMRCLALRFWPHPCVGLLGGVTARTRLGTHPHPRHCPSSSPPSPPPINPHPSPAPTLAACGRSGRSREAAAATASEPPPPHHHPPPHVRICPPNIGILKCGFGVLRVSQSFFTLPSINIHAFMHQYRTKHN